MASTSLLQPGSSVAVPAETRLLSLDVRWNTGTQTAFAERLTVAALPLNRGRLPGRDHVVFDNQPHTPDGSVRLGRQDGVVEIDLGAVAPDVEQVSIVVYVRPRPNAPRRTLDEVDGLSLSVADALTHEVIGRSASLHGLLGAVTGSTVADVVRGRRLERHHLRARSRERSRRRGSNGRTPVMTLQPPGGYGAGEPEQVPPPQPINPLPPTSSDAPDGSETTPGLQPDSPANVVEPENLQTQEVAVPASSADVPPPARALSVPPGGLDVVGGETVRLRKAVALDRVASGHGYLSITWNQRGHGLDLLALQENTAVSVRGHAITVDLSQPVGRVLIGTGTRGTMPLRPSELLVTNGATQLVVPILGGTSLGVWPRLSITRVDEFVVVRHELDPLSGVLGAVAGAYGYDERTFVLAHTT